MALVGLTAIGVARAIMLRKRKGYATLRSAAVLTASHVETDFIDLADFTVAGIFFDITQGSLTSFQYKVWQSIDGTTWFQEGSESVGAGTITDYEHEYTKALATDVQYYKKIDVVGRYLKLEVKGTGTVAGSSCAVYATGVY